MRKSFTLLPLGVCLFLSFQTFAQNSALELNDTNYVFYSGTDPVNPNGDFTVEFWAYVPSLIRDGQMHQFVSEGDETVQSAFYMGYDASGNIVVGNQWNDINGNPISTGVPMPVGQWTHLAFTFSDDYDTASLYVNGILRTSNANGYIFTDGQNFQIGVQTNGTQPMIGRIDELQTWSKVLTATQIRSGMLSTVNINDPNLNLYMNFNEGSGTTVDNLASNSPNAGFNGFIEGKGSPNSWLSSPVQFGDNGITLNGVTDQVNIPANSLYDLSSGTVEFWVNPTSLSNTFSTVLGNRGTGGVRYTFDLSSTQIAIDNGSAIGTIDYSLPLSTWTHLAFVNDGAQSTVYINGVPNGAIPGGFGSATGQPLTLGIAKNTSGPDTQPFSGGIDEVRIWNTRQSVTAILNNMDSTLLGNEPGLVGQFSFNDGDAGADNTGMTAAFDNTGNMNDGVLTNLAMTGTTSNIVSHPLTGVPLPILLTDFTTGRQDNTALLQWQTAQEENTREFLVQRSPDGTAFGTIGTVAAAGNSSIPLDYSFVDGSPLAGNNYYRLEEVDQDGYTTYTPVRLLNFSSSAQQLIWYATGYKAAEVRLIQGSNEWYILTDASGQTLRQGQLSGGKTDISGLPSGLYIVKVLTATGQALTTKVLLP
jgi:Concanavalin A-like lectin/glucanases superfamily